MNRQRRYQQTIEMAYRPDSGEVIRASELIDMDPQSFHDLRRQAKDTVRAIRRGEHREGGNRWFYHNGKAECPWYEGARLSQDRLRAVQFAGEKEGPEHRRLKQLIADSLERDPECAGRVDIEKVQRGRILVDERRRPDIHCTWRDRSIVFELQVSYTFLDVVLDRDRFYKSEGKWIIWVFNQPNEERAIYLDEKYYNKRHLFVLDAQAEAACIERGTLVLHCYYQRPVAYRRVVAQ